MKWTGTKSAAATDPGDRHERILLNVCEAMGITSFAGFGDSRPDRSGEKPHAEHRRVWSQRLALESASRGGRARARASPSPGRTRSARGGGSARRGCARRLPGLTSKNSPGHGDDLAARARRGRSPCPSLSGARQVGDRCPRRRTCRRARDRCATPRRAQAARACGRASRGTSSWIASVSATHVRRRRAAGSPRAAAACEPPPSRKRAGAGDRVDHLLRADGPGHAPARVAPVLGEAVEEHHRIAVDVLDVARGALDRQLARAAASRRSASRTRRSAARSRARARCATQRASSSPPTSLPVGLHGFDSSSADRPRPVDLAAQIVDARTRSRARPRAGSGSAVNALKMSSSSSYAV